MKLLLSLITLLFIFSNKCFSQSSSSSSSSSSCPEHYSGANCDILNHYVSGYQAAPPYGGSIRFNGLFGDDHVGLVVKVGNNICTPSYVSYFSIECWIDPLVLYQFYDVEITQNGITILKEDFYSPYIDDCGHGNFYLGSCQCYVGWTGNDCKTEASPFIDTINPTSVSGGAISAIGWFGKDGFEGSIYIGSNKLRIITAIQNTLYGYITQGPNGVSGYQDITIYDKNNQLIFTGTDMFLYDSNLCFSNCYNNGVCNNGTCDCDYPFVGNFCSHTIDSSCQCTY